MARTSDASLRLPRIQARDRGRPRGRREGEIVQLQFLIKAAVDNVVPLTGEYAKLAEPEEWTALRRVVYPEG